MDDFNYESRPRRRRADIDSFAPVRVPKRTHRRAVVSANIVLPVCSFWVATCVGLIAGASFGSALVVGLFAGVVVLFRDVMANRQGDGTVTVTRRRARALAYLDDLDDNTVDAMVDTHRQAVAAEKARQVEQAWDAFRKHAVSPIASLDPDSWLARCRELVKTLNDLGETVREPDRETLRATLDGTRVARDGAVVPTDYGISSWVESWIRNERARRRANG